MLGECHAHVYMDGADYREARKRHMNGPDEAAVRSVLKSYQERDITFVRDGGDPYHVSCIAKKLAPEYGITYLSPAFAIHKEGHYGGIVGRGFRTMKEYAHLVREAIDEGADFIKIMTTGIMDFKSDHTLSGDPIAFDEVREMVHIAHEEGMKVMSHTNGAKEVVLASMAGVDSIEHGNFQNEDSMMALRDLGPVWVPTTVTVANLIGSNRFEDEILKSILHHNDSLIRLAKEQGVSIALGSDAGAYRVPHGEGTENENERLTVLLGQEANEILQAGEDRIRTFVRE